MDIIITGGFIFCVVVLMYVFAVVKGGISKRNLKDWAFVGAVFSVMVLLFFADKANAEEWTYFEYIEAYLGIEYVLNDINPQCEPGGTDDRLISNGGIMQQIIGYGNADVNFGFRHHSCAINDDRFVSNAILFELTYRIDWR